MLFRPSLNVVAALACLSVAACSSQTYEPPVFNAVDPSIQCEAGNVGWDFSTGGTFSEDIRSAAISNELQIVEASYGANAECGLTFGNWTEVFAASCNGRRECERKVREDSEADPKIGCPKALQVKYRCGNEPAVYQVDVPGSPATDGTVVNLACGEKMTITHASYGANCNASLADNFTNKVVEVCSGLRRCRLNQGTPGLFGADPAPGCMKTAEAWYSCGNDPSERVARWGENEYPDFSCPARQREATPETVLRIVGGTYGANCNAAADNIKGMLEQGCNGKQSCTTRYPAVDPCPGRQKEFEARYTCGSGGNVYTKRIPREKEAPGATATLTCGDPLDVIEASYGKNCSTNNAHNLTARVKVACNDKRYCDMGKPVDLLTADPCPNVAKRATIVFTCANGSPVTREFGETESIQFECPIGRQTPGPSAGIRIADATYGANCVGAAANNNLYRQATSSCFGRDSCDLTAAGLADPKFGCAKELSVSYQCGEEAEVRTATVPASREGQPAQLSCGPVIRILTASYGENYSAAFAGNVGINAKEQCDGRRGRCVFSAVDLPDPAFGIEKDLNVAWVCGADPTPRFAHIDKPADGKSVSLDCSTPETPYVRKACVPATCGIGTRRDANLNCAVDNSMLRLGGIDESKLWVADSDGRVVRSFVEGYPYSINFQFKGLNPFTNTLGANASAGLPVSPATLWVTDTFIHIPGRPRAGSSVTVTGFRCIVGSVAMRISEAPGEEDRLVGQTQNAIVPPSCFGARIGSWRDAAKRLGWNEADFRNSYRMVDDRHDLHVSFDPEGRSVRWFVDYTSSSNAYQPAPNPIGFFYRPDRLWADLLEYYRQSEFPTTVTRVPNTAANRSTNGWGFTESSTIELKADSAVLRQTSFRVPLYGSSDLAFDVDFRWSMLGDAPGKNPYSPTGRPLSSLVRAISERNLGATVEVAKNVSGSGQAWVPISDSELLNRPLPRPDYLLSGGLATGKNERLHVVMSDKLRKRILRSTSQGGWGEARADLRVRVCLSLDGVGDRSYTDWLPDGQETASRNGVDYSVLIKSKKRCVESLQRLRVTRDLRRRGEALTNVEVESQAGRAVDQGDSNVSTSNDMGSVVGCSGADGGVGRCSEATRSVFNSAGGGGRSLYASSTSTSGRQVGDNAEVSVGARTEVLSYSVINADADNPQTTGSIKLGWQSAESLRPKINWGTIVRLAKASLSSTKTSPVKPKINQWNRRAKFPGIGIGLSAEGVWPIGPIPVAVEISFGVSIAPGADASFKSRWVGPGSALGSDDYPCIGNDRCLILSTGLLTHQEANQVCRNRGGRLAELSSASAVSAAQQRVGFAHEEFWIGAQLAYEYGDPSCTDSPTAERQCGTSNSSTYYEWLDDGRPFAQHPTSIQRC